MNVQTLSVVVPTRLCFNKCRFCVSRMREECYKNQMDDNKRFYDLYLKDYLKRLEFARDNGCNTVMLTGNAEPQQNMNFLTDFGLFMMLLERPFRNIEMQTTGIMIDDQYLRFLRNHVGVNTISLSLSALDDDLNQDYNGTLDRWKVNIQQLCSEIKRYDFNLRLSLNLTDFYDRPGFNTPWQIFRACQELGADQVTFRVFYGAGNDTEQGRWIQQHSANPLLIENIRSYIQDELVSRPLEILEYGATRYSVHGMSVVLDDDCMSEEAKRALKYLILRPDCKLYSKWDDPASLVF